MYQSDWLPQEVTFKDHEIYAIEKCCRNTTSIVILILITFEVLVLEVGLRVVSVCPCIYSRTEVLVFTVVCACYLDMYALTMY